MMLSSSQESDFHRKDTTSVVAQTLKQKIHLDLSSRRTERRPTAPPHLPPGACLPADET